MSGCTSCPIKDPSINFLFKGFTRCTDCTLFRQASSVTVIYRTQTGAASMTVDTQSFVPCDLSDNDQVDILRAHLIEGDFDLLPDPAKYRFMGWRPGGDVYAPGETVTIPDQVKTVELAAVYHPRVVYHQNKEEFRTEEGTFVPGTDPKAITDFDGWPAERFLGWSLDPDAREASFPASGGALPCAPSDLPLHLYAVYEAEPGETGSVQGGSTDLAVTAGETVYLSLKGEQIGGPFHGPIAVTYDPAALRLLNLAAQVGNCQAGTGRVEGTNLTALSLDAGELILTSDESIPENGSLSGMLTMLAFEALIDGETSVAVEVR